MLRHLEFSARAAKEFLGKIRSQPISGYSIGDKIYVDIRCYSTEWYDNELTFLTDRYDKVYVVIYEVTGVYNRFLKAYCPVYDERWEATSGPCKLDSYWCYAFGHRRALTDEMVLVTPELCRDHPQLISPDASTRQRVLEFHFPECRVVPPPPPVAPKLSSIPPTTRQLRSADRPAPTLFMLRPTPDKKPLPRAIVPAKSLRRDDPLHLKIDVPDLLRRQAEDYEYECAYYAQFGFASPSGRHVSSTLLLRAFLSLLMTLKPRLRLLPLPSVLAVAPLSRLKMKTLRSQGERRRRPLSQSHTSEQERGVFTPSPIPGS